MKRDVKENIPLQDTESGNLMCRSTERANTETDAAERTGIQD